MSSTADSGLVRRSRRVVALSVCAVVGSTWAATGLASASPRSAVTKSTVTYAAFPSPGLSNYDVAGRYPQVAGAANAKVNAAIKAAFVAFEKSYAKEARGLSPAPAGERGTFDVTLASTSASSSVVSTLIGLDTVFPGGNDGEGFLSLTVTAPAGKTVKLSQLFTHDQSALTAIAAAAKRQVLAVNHCVASGFNDPEEATVNASGFAPTAANYAHWALLPTGLRIGFDQGQLSVEACGYVSTVVPWSVLRPYLNTFGKTLESGVRGQTVYALPGTK